LTLQIYISQGSVATQLRCGGKFSNHFITNFPQNVWVKKISKIGQYLGKIWTKVSSLLFEPPCICICSIVFGVIVMIIHNMHIIILPIWIFSSCM